MSLETLVVTLFFLHTGKLFIIGAALGKHKKERAGERRDYVANDRNC